MSRPEPKDKANAIECCGGSRPTFVTLRERLAAGNDAAEAAWAAKTSAAFKEAVSAVTAAVRGFDLRAIEITSSEDATRLRAEFAETLRAAAAAVAPRIV